MARLTIKPESVARLVCYVRGERVMLDADLARLYDVETGALNRAAKRNPARFPEDFMFRLTEAEWANLKCQVGISSDSHGGRRALPQVFTEHGVAMLSSVLHSSRAIEALEGKYDEQFAVVFDAIKQLVADGEARKTQPKRRIGFVP